MARPDVVMSRYLGYTPGMMWTPTRDEVVLSGNLMRHADVCVSPGSTMTIEPAIFDTPTILPILNPLMPEDYDALFNELWISRHFRALVDNDQVPVVRSVDELAAAINRALDDPSWYREQRAEIRSSLCGPLDGGAIPRIVDVLQRAARRESRR